MSLGISGLRFNCKLHPDLSFIVVLRPCTLVPEKLPSTARITRELDQLHRPIPKQLDCVSGRRARPPPVGPPQTTLGLLACRCAFLAAVSAVPGWWVDGPSRSTYRYHLRAQAFWDDFSGRDMADAWSKTIQTTVDGQQSSLEACNQPNARMPACIMGRARTPSFKR